MSVIRLKVNGLVHTLNIETETPLLYILRNDLNLNGPKFGCGLGQCGACTVIVGGVARRSCILPVGSVKDSEVTTLEGLGSVAKMHPIQKSFLDNHAAQCGYCINGFVLTAKAFLDAHPRATDSEIVETLSANLCRCGTHQRILAAVKQYAQEVSR